MYQNFKIGLVGHSNANMSPGGRIWKTSDDATLVWMTMTPDRVPGALEVIRKGFLPYESVSIGVMLAQREQATQEFLQLCEVVAQDGVSLVTVDVATDRVVGVAFNKIQTKPKEGEPNFLDVVAANFQDSASLAIKDFLIDVDGRVDPFALYGGVTSFLELMFLGVLPEFCGKKIAVELVKCTETMAAALQRGEVVVPDTNSKNVGLVMAVFTSTISQRIGRTQQWDELARIAHDQYTFEGKTFSERIGPLHPDNALMAKRIVAGE